MIEAIMEDFIIALEIGRILCADYFIYDRKTKTFQTDYSFSTKLLTLVRIVSLTSTVYLSLPQYGDLNVIILFQAMESVTIYVLSIILFTANYFCQEYNVCTYRKIMEVETLLLELNLLDVRNFKNSLKRLVVVATIIFVVTVSSVYLLCAYNGRVNLLSLLTVSTAVVGFYKITSFIIVFLILWYYYKIINRCLEKLYFRKQEFCNICNYNNTIKAPKEKLCKRHLIK